MQHKEAPNTRVKKVWTHKRIAWLRNPAQMSRWSRESETSFYNFQSRRHHHHCLQEGLQSPCSCLRDNLPPHPSPLLRNLVFWGFYFFLLYTFVNVEPVWEHDDIWHKCRREWGARLFSNHFSYRTVICLDFCGMSFHNKACKAYFDVFYEMSGRWNIQKATGYGSMNVNWDGIVVKVTVFTKCIFLKPWDMCVQITLRNIHLWLDFTTFPWTPKQLNIKQMAIMQYLSGVSISTGC